MWHVHVACAHYIAPYAPWQGHTLVLTVDGEVYSFGDNGYGQCGNVTEHVQTLPMRVPLPLEHNETATAVRAGNFLTLTRALTTDPNPETDPNPNPDY